MKKVIHVLTDRNIGGAGRWLLNMLRYADRERYETKVLLPEDSLLTEKVKALGFEVLRLPGMIDRSWDKASLSTMTELFRAEAPDIVHVGASLTARIAARRAKVPALVITKHCAAVRGSFISRMARGAVDGLFADAVVAVSEEVGRELAAAGTPRRKICVIPNGIAAAQERSEVLRAELRSTYALDAEKHLVGIAARLEIVKGVDLFIRAA
ncbi:MAG: glycosyltransferase, partial [Oscillospiraceae bacterium]|nr:glycosyltransferase [Oscillospiraceae bacterium]